MPALRDVGRFLRTRAAPLVLWIGTMAAALWLWRDVEVAGTVIGFAQSAEFRISTLRDGRIESVAVELGQAVEAGQVVAILDSSEIDAEMRVLEAERRRIEAATRAAEVEAEERLARTTTSLDQSKDSLEVALDKARATRRALTAELKALQARRKELADLVERRMTPRADLADVEVRVATLKEEIAAAGTTAGLLATQVESAVTRRGGQPEGSVEAAAAPLRAEAGVVDAQLRQLERQRGELVLRAPTSGTVATVLLRRGEVARVGDPVVTLVSSSSDRVVACLAEDQALSVGVGARATLRPRGRAGAPIAGHVMSLGPILEEVPIRCRQDPRRPTWGRDVVIALDDRATLLPGQAFTVELDRLEEAPGGALAATTAPKTTGPRPMAIPAALSAISRFEPSGLVWVPGLSRYLVVSDDTGVGGNDEHFPWLFAMAPDGRVDAAPLVIAGAGAVSDLEAIARGPDGGIYVMASQSMSRKGKRPPARTLFARLESVGTTLRVTGSVHLAELLDASEAPVRGALGLGNGTGELDIEGLAASDGGLLLGLKAPRDAAGDAIIWRMGSPERLVGSGRLDDAALSLWATIPLQVEADGRTVPGGIAELLRLPDGSLLVAATASGLDPAHQSGSLWLVPAGATGRVTARRVEVFPGLKPEGLALGPEAGRLAVVFDTGAETPLWLDLPWPRG